MRTVVYIVVLLLIGAFLALLLFPAISSTGHPDGRSEAKNSVVQLIIAAKGYRAEYGESPKGDRKTILQVLQGKNPSKIIFIKLDPKRITKDGIFVDPWDSPYAFGLSDPTDPWAYSFGKNKIDEGGHNDDVTSWK